MIIAEAMHGAMNAVVVYDGNRGPGATQLISFGQPFDTAAGTCPINICFEKHYTESSDIEKAFGTRNPSLLVLSRYTSALGLEWIRLARSAGIPVVYHIDDDLLAVPRSLGDAKFKAYNRPERLKALRDNVENCDLLYVSTDALASRFEEHGIRTPIVAGDVYCSVQPEHVGALLAPSSDPVIGYMGTGGHSADLAMILPAICEVMEAIPGLQFETFGTIQMPPELIRFGDRVRHISPVADYSDFVARLRSLGWWVGLAPLENNAFNLCKADTKWVEYSLAGMASVCSELPVYQRSCAGGAGILAGSRDAWVEALKALIYNPGLREGLIESAQRRLRELYTHDRLRAQVMNVFDRAFALRKGSIR